MFYFKSPPRPQLDNRGCVPVQRCTLECAWLEIDSYTPIWFTRPLTVTYPGTNRNYVDRGQRVTTKPNRQPRATVTVEWNTNMKLYVIY